VSDALLSLAFCAAAATSLGASWLLAVTIERIGARLGLGEVLLGMLAALVPSSSLLVTVTEYVTFCSSGPTSALLAPFTDFPTGSSQADRNRLTASAKQLYTGSVRPAFVRLHDYVTNTYIPACRENIAATALPNGAAAYAYHVRWQTTTDLTPQQIHEIGLSEVKRIRAEMDRSSHPPGSRAAFTTSRNFCAPTSAFISTSRKIWSTPIKSSRSPWIPNWSMNSENCRATSTA